MGHVRFAAVLVPRGPGVAVVLDDEQVAAVGEGARRFPVRATINGYSWRTSVARMGGEFVLGLNREVREGAGASVGDAVEVEISLDTAPREVDVPEALSRALDSDPVARASFDALAYTHRKEFARWIEDATREETRRRRLEQALAMLRAGTTRS